MVGKILHTAFLVRSGGKQLKQVLKSYLTEKGPTEPKCTSRKDGYLKSGKIARETLVI